MRRVLAIATCALLAACAQDAGEPGTEFTLSGTVIEVREGDEPDGVPDLDEDTDEDSGDDDTIDPGAIVVEADSPVDDCDPTGGRYVVYYRGDTVFDPLDAPEADDFPDSLEGAEVEVSGTYYRPEGPDDDCVFVAGTIELPDDDGDDAERPGGGAATVSPGPRPTGTGGDSTATPTATEADEGTATSTANQ